jgi:hypothetical protein
VYTATAPLYPASGIKGKIKKFFCIIYGLTRATQLRSGVQ